MSTYVCTDIKSLLWELIVLCSWMPALAYSVGNTVLVSIGIYATIVLLFFLFLWEFSVNTKVKKDLLYVILLLLLYVVYTVLKLEIISLYEIRAILYLGLMIMSFYLCVDKRLQIKSLHSLYFYPVILSVLMLVLSFNKGFYESFAEGQYSLYLGFQNPNILSYVIVIMIIYLLLGYFDEKKKLYLFSVAIDLYLLYLTHCRSSMLAVLFLLFFVVLNRRPKKQSRIISCGYSLIPGLFVAVALSLGGISLNIMGKSGIAGRDMIWDGILELASSDVVFLLSGKNRFSREYLISNDFFTNFDVLKNAHNAFMQLFSNYGIIITGVFIFWLCWLTIKIGRCVSDRYTYTAYIGTIAILINCSFETHIVDAIIGMTFLWILLYRLVLVKGKEDDYNTKIS